MSVSDERVKGWFSVEKAHCDLIAGSFGGRRLPVARSVYFAIVRLANDGRAESGSRDVLEATRRKIATEAGVNPRVVDEYTGELERLGLLRIERRKEGVTNLPNRWALTSPLANGDVASTGSGDPEDTTLLTAGSQGWCAQDREGGGADDTLRREEVEEGEEQEQLSSLRSEDARASNDDNDGDDVLPKLKHGRRSVPADRHRLALAILASFNRLMGTSHGAYKGTGGASPSLSRILTFLTEATEPVTLDVAERMIEHARLNPYWAPSPPTTGNVFSGQAGERNLQAATNGIGSSESAGDRMARLTRARTEEAERRFRDPPRDPSFDGFERDAATGRFIEARDPGFDLPHLTRTSS